ncbi:MAG: HlyD family efflux transporter periplasmic adaptor subunit [Hyphomicrobium sp.]
MTFNADHAPNSATHPTTHRATPALDVRLPVVMGLTVVVAFFGVGIGAAAYAPIAKGVGLPGTIIVETKVKPVQHQRGGQVSRIHVSEGQLVKAGDILITLDTQSVDDQLVALKAQAELARRQLSLARDEAATMADLLDRKLAARSRVLGLERQVAELEKESAGLVARIAVAEQELQRAELRAPVAGRVLKLKVASEGAVVPPGGTVLDIVPDSDRLVIEGRLQPNQIEALKPGMPAKVWLSALSWREQRPLAARLAWVSADSVEDQRTGQPYFIARVELEERPPEATRQYALHPGMRAEMVLLTGERTLLDQLIDPIMRNINRAFRG